MPKQLAEAPSLPEGLSYVWLWYMELASGEYLSFTEIKAWAELNGLQPFPWEVKLIKSLDRVYWKVYYER